MMDFDRKQFIMQRISQNGGLYQQLQAMQQNMLMLAGELDALKGARQTILRNKPKLAICLYHKTKDYIEIPNWIHTLVPEYKLYVRHHSFSINETVLYAIPPET